MTAWLAWREAYAAARSASGGGGDHLKHELARWWRAAGLPRVEQLTDAQAVRVLDEIDRLDWSTRPFDPPVESVAR